ncbi:MAG: DUF1579 domain-containing protein [Gemmatimonadota bacterium]|nr:MAG: DUF1579 domain-containing protein [Gemmatimonadota bacterium]
MARRTPLLACLLTFLALSASSAAAQEDDMAATMAAWQKAGQPGVQHQHLAALVGTWDAETKFWMDPSAEPMASTGTIEYRMVMDGRYLEEVITSEIMGRPFKGRGLYGYNNVTGELEAVWIDDMSTGIYWYSGSINEAGDEVSLKSKYIDPITKEWRNTRSVMRISSDKLHYESYETFDGQERKTMEITGIRK